jgi:hypothetical protein
LIERKAPAGGAWESPVVDGTPDIPGSAGDTLELAALRIRERAQTLRLSLCVVAAVLLMACLIPIANGRPRFPRLTGRGSRARSDFRPLSS